MGRKRSRSRDIDDIERSAFRSAEHRILDGHRISSPPTDSWSGTIREDKLPLIDDVMPHQSKRKKGCKRSKTGEHDPVPRYVSKYRMKLYVCVHCTKIMWGYRSPDEPRKPFDLDEWLCDINSRSNNESDTNSIS